VREIDVSAVTYRFDIRGTNIRGKRKEGKTTARRSSARSQSPSSTSFKSMLDSDHIYSRLVESIAPTVYGHEHARRACCYSSWVARPRRRRKACTLRGDLTSALSVTVYVKYNS